MQGKLKRTFRSSSELNRKAEYIGKIRLADMPRLLSLVINNNSDINVSFEFGFNQFNKPLIKGHYGAALEVECQRCLEPMVHSIDQTFELLIDASEEDIEAFQLDSVYTSEGYLDVFEVVEDELILALPIIMMHEESSCNTYWQSEPEEALVEEKNNPFAVLAALKDTD